MPTWRSPLLPGVSTVAGSVSGYQNYDWSGLWAPNGTLQRIIEKLHAQAKKALAEPAVEKRIVKAAGVPMDFADRQH